ncbi:hypothetical protein BDW22DRAFT_1361074 [Trametopsis cervina]|nr:hypothetical protein BDW22DRAFT_1361074 [Trametopsis cervina]
MLGMLWPRVLSLICFFTSVNAKTHHDHFGTTYLYVIWTHIFLQVTVWLVMFPVAMVLGLRGSRWYVPLQSLGCALTMLGYVLGYTHGGRSYHSASHRNNALFLLVPLITHLVLAIYLRYQPQESIKPSRKWLDRTHGILGKLLPVLGWVQVLVGVATFGGYCRGDNAEQCTLYYTAGSGLLAYGIVLAIVILSGEAWIVRSSESPEWWESWVVLAGGVVNLGLAVEDRAFLVPGVLWLLAGAASLFFAKDNNRTAMPSIVIIVTAWTCTQHGQELAIYSKMHAAFGFTLLAAGGARLLEVLLLKPKYVSPSDVHDTTYGWQANENVRRLRNLARPLLYLPPFLFMCSGFLALGSTDEGITYIHQRGVDLQTYIFLIYTAALLLYGKIAALVWLYHHCGDELDSDRNNDAVELTSKGYVRIPTGDRDGDEDGDGAM